LGLVLYAMIWCVFLSGLFTIDFWLINDAHMVDTFLIGWQRVQSVRLGSWWQNNSSIETPSISH
jgi:hypothetical protein